MWVQSTKLEKDFLIKRRVNKSSNTFKRNLSSTLSPVKNDNANKKFTSLLIKSIKPYSSTSLGLTSTSWCLYDSKNKRQLGFRQFYQRQIASLTKIMTAILSIQTVQKFQINANMQIKVTDSCSKMIGTSANLKSGQWVLLKDLYYGTLLPSGNDAAYLLSEVIGFFLLASQNKGNIQHFKDFQEIDLTKENTNNYVSEFIKKMNQKAIELQLSLSNYSNQHGLQNALNVSTAKDVLNLSIYATQNHKFRKVMNCQTHRYQVKTGQNLEQKQIRRWWNTNQLLKKGFQGVKTGQTITAGNCLSSLRNGIFIVVLNCKTNESRFKQTQKLYEWYMQNHLEFFQNDEKHLKFQS